LLVKGNFFDSRCPEALTAYALIRLVASPDETGQFMHAAVIRATIDNVVIEARLACIVLSHGSKVDAPAGCKTRILRAFGHWPSLSVPHVPAGATMGIRKTGFISVYLANTHDHL
jgi:hypothetical protein